MKSDRGVLVAIVGGGFSGTILAEQLARRAIPSLLIEASGLAGQGLPYQPPKLRSTKTPCFAYGFSCTGPLHAIERTCDRLLRSILDARLARPDHLGIGLEVDSNCCAGEPLWALGPLTKGRYWEITSVPDIREQAAQVARDIEREIQQWVRPSRMAIQ